MTTDPTTPKQIEVNGAVYIRKDAPTEPSDWKIVVLQRGWVLVGRYSRDGDDCVLEDAKVIRRWGTTAGLGQLVDGPLSETVLDDAGRVEFHVLTQVFAIDANPEAWA